MSLVFVVLIPFLGSLLPPLMVRAGRTSAALTAGTVSLISFLLLLSNGADVFLGAPIIFHVPWLPRVGLNAHFFLDGLGFLFATLILGIGLLVILYARYYLSKKDPMGWFYSYLLLFQGAMLGIVLSDNILLLMIFWELTSLSSFLLIGFWKHLPEGRQGARMALAVTGGGGLALLAGMLLLGNISGSYDLSVILNHKEAIQSSPHYLTALILILVGCFAKSAQFPFHFWLPHAMAAPTPVSSYLHSATMVKAGVFLMARLWPVLSGTPQWFVLVSGVGLVTMIFGAVVAFYKDDLKSLLAYSTISHLGLMTMLLGFGSATALIAAIFHIINHATFKAALFMNAGVIDHEVGTRDIQKLGGLKVLMPATATLGMVAAASMAGIPLFNGFLSKEMMLEAVYATPWLDNPWILPVLATVAAIFSVAYSFRYIQKVFLGPVRSTYPSAPHDPGWGLFLPPGLLVSLVILIGLFPETFAGSMVRLASAAVLQGSVPDFQITHWHGLTPAFLSSLTAIVVGALLLWSYTRWRRWWDHTPRPEAKVIFDGFISLLGRSSAWIVSGLHNGSLPRYLSLIFFSALVMGGVTFATQPFSLGTRATLPITPVAVMGWLLLVGCTLLVVRLHHQRLIALVIGGVVGLIVSIGFIYLSAPDLALTQISVEVVTVILMLLALSFLPKTTPLESSSLRRLGDAALAGLGGLSLGALTYVAITRDFVSLSDFYLEQAKPAGGGTNVVNVILVDFRGFDTFGEIIVLSIASLTIYALLDGAINGPLAKKLRSWKPDQMISPERHPMMMVVATRVMLPLALLVGVYIFLRGHNLPGGGFIAGLVVSIALIMQYMASGFGWAARQLKVDYQALIGYGVLIAAFTGIVAMVFGAPFLTSTFDYFPIPLVGEVELASAMAFDVGVFLTVVGAVMLILANLSRLSRLAGKLPINKTPMDDEVSPGVVKE
jgi:multicomponent K+:H+ antiporter subunit A